MSQKTESIELPENMSGMLLVATPTLLDPNFRRTVVFLRHHSRQEGAMGFVLNRPLPVRLGEVTTSRLEGVAGQLRLYYGGPVLPEQIMILGMRWDGERRGLEVRVFDREVEVEDVPAEWLPHVRLFVGHSGWAPGQLENEIKQYSWIVHPPVQSLFESEDSSGAWREILSGLSPVVKLIADCPEDPSLN